MPAPERHNRHQHALLWAATGYDDDGQPTRATSSVEILVRWETAQSFMLDPNGNKIAIDAVVFTDQAIALGSTMWEGSLTDLAAAEPGTGTGTDVEPVTDLYQVVAQNVMRDIKGRVSQRQIGLKLLSDTIPKTQAEA